MWGRRLLLQAGVELRWCDCGALGRRWAVAPTVLQLVAAPQPFVTSGSPGGRALPTVHSIDTPHQRKEPTMFSRHPQQALQQIAQRSSHRATAPGLADRI